MEHSLSEERRSSKGENWQRSVTKKKSPRKTRTHWDRNHYTISNAIWLLQSSRPLWPLKSEIIIRSSTHRILFASFLPSFLPYSKSYQTKEEQRQQAMTSTWEEERLHGYNNNNLGTEAIVRSGVLSPFAFHHSFLPLSFKPTCAIQWVYVKGKMEKEVEIRQERGTVVSFFPLPSFLYNATSGEGNAALQLWNFSHALNRQMEKNWNNKTPRLKPQSPKTCIDTMHF